MEAWKALPGDGAYKILIIEDSPYDRALYRRLLHQSDASFSVYEAENLSDGIELSRRLKMDCILLDCRLPDAHGTDFLRLCRTEGFAPDAAIVMVSGQDNVQTAVDAMKLGALDFLIKNTAMERYFVQNIMNAIERASLKRRLRESQQELENSYKALTDFAHTASHDLQAPLRRVRQFCNLLKEETGDRLGPEGLDYVERLTTNVIRLQKLVEDLLTYSGAANGREGRAEIDLNVLVADVIEDVNVSVIENNARILLDELPTLSVYPVRMRGLFQNLICNALKYRSEEDPIIRIFYEEEPSRYVFSVKDNGIGIDEEYHHAIFTAFERLCSQDAVEGSGLGLSICKKVVEKHGGEIWVESSPGQGATFKFTIPK